MAGFRFNFSQNEQNVGGNEELGLVHETERSTSVATAVKVTEQHSNITKSATIHSLTLGSGAIRYLQSGDDIENQLKRSDSRISCALSLHSDLIPGVYEGGLKIWECSVDLVSYLGGNVTFHPQMSVLELGCGAGLPGILAHVRGASCVVFQDFNEEVLDALTIPNVLLNSDNQAAGCSFLAGDWSAVSTQISEIAPSFDIILTSETIYNVASQPKLLQLMKTFLKSDGCVYLAAKSYYFGVGGSVFQFEDLVRKDGTFQTETCRLLEDGVKRMILKLSFKNEPSEALPS